MGRQDTVEIFEDTQRLYSSNERLISARIPVLRKSVSRAWDGTGMAQSIGFIKNQRRL